MDLLNALVVFAVTLLSFMHVQYSVPPQDTQILGENTAASGPASYRHPTNTPYPTRKAGTDLHYRYTTPSVNAGTSSVITIHPEKREPILTSSNSGEVHTAPLPTPQILHTSELKYLTATTSSAIKEQLYKAYTYVQQTNPPNKAEIIQRLKNEYMTVMTHVEDKVKTTANAVIEKANDEKEKTAEEKKQFQMKLAAIRDTKKQAVIQTIDTKIAAINYKAVEIMNTALNRLSTLLTAINSQMFSLETDTQAIMEIQNKSLEAQTLITEAQQAVLEQANKSYVLPISSDEARLKGQISPVVTKLHTDLNAARAAVIRAKDAVNEVYQEVYKLKSQSGLVASPSAH